MPYMYPLALAYACARHATSSVASDSDGHAPHLCHHAWAAISHTYMHGPHAPFEPCQGSRAYVRSTPPAHVLPSSLAPPRCHSSLHLLQSHLKKLQGDYVIVACAAAFFCAVYGCIRAVALALHAKVGWAIQVMPRPCAAPSRQLVYKDSWREQSSCVFKGPWSSHAWLVPCWHGVCDPHAGRCAHARHAPASLGGCPSSLPAHPPVPLRGPHACVAKELALMHAQCLHRGHMRPVCARSAGLVA